MSASFPFSVARWWSIVLKEFLQLKRDRITFAMIVGLPIIQLTLFGYAINTDPKHLPTAIVVREDSVFARSFVAGMRNSAYFDVIETLPDEASARHALARGTVQFVLSIPVDFSRRLLRGERPSLLVEADASDPTAITTALAALPGRKIVLTNGPEDYAHAVLAALGIEGLFERVIAIEGMRSRSYWRAKPDCAMLRGTLRRAGVALADAILIEDTRSHLKRYRRLGIRTVWITGHLPAHLPGTGRPHYVDRRIRSLKSLKPGLQSGRSK
ncbi:HAD-IA family hydrolase [Paraburkholderia sp. BR14261]